MMNPLLYRFVRTRLRLTSRERALKQAEHFGEKYVVLATALSEAQGRLPVTVPPMLGVDEDMRGWSYFQLLEHNAIVGRRITAVVRQLAEGKPVTELAPFSIKHDVMPGQPGPEQIDATRAMVAAHLETVRTLEGLRRTTTELHSHFGPMTAHMWHVMFTFHLELHYKQAIKIAAEAKAS